MSVRLYEFKCKECDERYLFPDRTSDFVCCSSPVVRTFSIAGISFKGSGFYKNDSQ